MDLSGFFAKFFKIIFDKKGENSEKIKKVSKNFCRKKEKNLEIGIEKNQHGFIFDSFSKKNKKY